MRANFDRTRLRSGLLMSALLLLGAASWLPACEQNTRGEEAVEELKDEAGDVKDEIEDEVDDAT
jgi:hypothetical protein